MEKNKLILFFRLSPILLILIFLAASCGSPDEGGEGGEGAEQVAPSTLEEGGEGGEGGEGIEGIEGIEGGEGGKGGEGSTDASESLRLAEKIVNEFRKGQIAFNTPQQMPINDTKEIELKITDDLEKILNVEVKKGEIIERKKIDIYHILKAELTGTGFEIKSLQQDDTFLLLPNKVVERRWAVTPTKPGKQKLVLRINAKLKIDDFETTYTVETFKRIIEVQVNPKNWFQQNWFRIIELSPYILGSGFVAFTASNFKKINSWIKKIYNRLKP